MNKVNIIAEIGVNHNGSLEMAMQMTKAAADAGTDIVKFQVFSADRLTTQAAEKAEYQKATTAASETQWAMLKRLELPDEAFINLKRYAEELGVEFMATPFDPQSLQFLASTLQTTRLKIGSGDLTDGPLLLSIARTGKPVLLSTGMSTLSDVESALQVLAFGYTNADKNPDSRSLLEAYCSQAGQDQLKRNVTLLHCTTEYPAPMAEVNLQTIQTLRGAFGLPVGYSDHTEGVIIPLAAVSCGAVCIEKHFTLDRSLPGPDHAASLEPNEFAEMVRNIRTIEQAMGTPIKAPTISEIKNVAIARKSLVAKSFIAQGELFTSENITVRRPGTGVSPLQFWSFLGKTATKDYQPGELVR